MSDLSIGKHAPIPRYMVRKVPNKKIDIAIGLLNGLENLLTFSIKGKIINPSGINVWSAIPKSLFGTTLSIWKTGYRYHSGRISKGVANGFALSPSIAGSRTASPTTQAIVPKITTGKIYNRSLGQAGSP